MTKCNVCEGSANGYHCQWGGLSTGQVIERPSPLEEGRIRIVTSLEVNVSDLDYSFTSDIASSSLALELGLGGQGAYWSVSYVHHDQLVV